MRGPDRALQNDGDGIQGELFPVWRLTRVHHQQRPARGGGGPGAPSPRPGRASHRRAQGWATGPPAVGSVQREQGVVAASGDRPEPGQSGRCRRLHAPGPHAHPAYPRRLSTGAPDPSRPAYHGAPARAVTLAAPVAAAVADRPRPSRHRSHHLTVLRAGRAPPYQATASRRQSPKGAAHPPNRTRPRREELAHRGQSQGVQVQEGSWIKVGGSSLRHVEVLVTCCPGSPLIIFAGPRSTSMQQCTRQPHPNKPIVLTYRTPRHEELI